ncbi:MAG: translation initiation factor IF-2 subunit beta [Candidatus Aenigmatarchaeota archaeon]
MKSYEELLEEALKKLPEKVEIKDRYALPEINVIYVKNKTIVKNIYEILEKIKRSEKDFKKIFFRIIGIPGRFEKEGLVLNAVISKDVIKRKLEEYVQNFVVCEVCGKPETIIIEEEGIKYLKCEACGAKKIIRL